MKTRTGMTGNSARPGSRLWLTVLLFVLTAAFAGSVQAKTLTAAEKASIRYAQYLFQHEEEGRTGYVEEFGVVMLDNNNIPDLIEKTDTVATVIFLNGKTYKGKIRTWSDMFATYYVFPKKGVYAYYVYDSDGSTRSKFLFRQLYVRTKGYKDDYIAGYLKNPNGSLTYYGNEKESISSVITKAAYEKRIKKFVGNVLPKKVTFYKNTTKNRKKYLGDDGTIPTITLSKKKLSMDPGDSKRLTATVEYADASIITWRSSNPKAVTVEADPENKKLATVTARQGGVASIVAEIEGKEKVCLAICKVTVNAPSIELNKSSDSVYRSKTIKLKATVTGPSGKVTWKSSDKKIATVSKGVVKGLKPGSVKITATANGKSDTCTVTVKALKENVKGLTPIQTGKTYAVKMNKKNNPVVITRDSKKLFIDENAVLTIRKGYPAYSVYVTDLNTKDNYREILELYTDNSGKSAMTLYRYDPSGKGSLSSYASVSGKKGSLAGGFSYKKGKAVKMPGNGMILLDQDLQFGGSENVTATVKYTVASNKISPVVYDDRKPVGTQMTCKEATLAAGKKYTAYDEVDGEAFDSIGKKEKFRPLAVAYTKKAVYLKVRISLTDEEGWLKFPAAQAVYR